MEIAEELERKIHGSKMNQKSKRILE